MHARLVADPERILARSWNRLGSRLRRELSVYWREGPNGEGRLHSQCGKKQTGPVVPFLVVGHWNPDCVAPGAEQKVAETLMNTGLQERC